MFIKTSSLVLELTLEDQVLQHKLLHLASLVLFLKLQLLEDANDVLKVLSWSMVNAGSQINARIDNISTSENATQLLMPVVLTTTSLEPVTLVRTMPALL